MSLPSIERIDRVNHPDLIREVIPRHTRSGLLRRVGLPDGGLEFIESTTDRVFARFDAQGRYVAEG